jgi:hypothetical protein
LLKNQGDARKGKKEVTTNVIMLYEVHVDMKKGMRLGIQNLN